MACGVVVAIRFDLLDVFRAHGLFVQYCQDED